MRYFLRILLLGCAMVVPTSVAEASTGTGVGGVFLEFVGLLLAFACFVVSWKVLSFVRGGRLAAAWQWLTSAFFAFAAAQALSLLVELSFLPVAGEIVIFLRASGLFLLLFGMLKMRKALA